jgi:transcription termination/antitermination protein NusG
MTETLLSEGGEALPIDTRNGDAMDRHDEIEPPRAPRWFVVWTASHCERLVYEQLCAARFETFLPTMRTWSRQRGARRAIAVPMFAGYLFVRCGMDKRSYVDIVKIRGVVRLLGEAWDRLAPVPDDEIATIRRVVETDVPVFPYPYLHDGQPVRITDGPLKGVEGVLVESKPRKGLLVVSVSLLQRSIAVEVGGTDVVPVSTICRSQSLGWGRAALAAQGLRASEA